MGATPLTTRPFRRPSACPLLIGVALLGAGAPMPGCKSTSTPTEAATQSAERTNEAVRLAEEARRAELAGDDARAIELYRQSLRYSDDLFYAWNNLGVLLMKQQNYVDAVSVFKVAAEIKPTDPTPLENIGTAYYNRKWHQKALEYYLLALERDPTYLQALRGAIRAGYSLGLADEASLERVKAAIMRETDPDYRGFFEREQFRIEAALRDKTVAAGG